MSCTVFIRFVRNIILIREFSQWVLPGRAIPVFLFRRDEATRYDRRGALVIFDKLKLHRVKSFLQNGQFVFAIKQIGSWKSRTIVRAHTLFNSDIPDFMRAGISLALVFPSEERWLSSGEKSKENTGLSSAGKFLGIELLEKRPGTRRFDKSVCSLKLGESVVRELGSCANLQRRNTRMLQTFADIKIHSSACVNNSCMGKKICWNNQNSRYLKPDCLVRCKRTIFLVKVTRLVKLSWSIGYKRSIRIARQVWLL